MTQEYFIDTYLNPSILQAEPEAIAHYLNRPPTLDTIAPYQMDTLHKVPTGITSIDQLANQLEASEIARFSPNILADPGAKLYFQNEATEYFSRKQRHEPDYYSLLQKLCATVTDSELTVRPRTSICIAVAAHEESEGLYNTIAAYTDQVVEDGFEIILYMNNPSHMTDGTPANTEPAYHAVSQAKHDFPHLPIIAIKHQYNGDAGLGRIKRTLHDIAIGLHVLRGTLDPILILNDADTISVPTKYISTQIAAFTDDPTMDAVAGSLEWERTQLSLIPELLLATRAYQYINTIKTAKSARPILAGNNMAVRGSAYCAAGGGRDGKRGVDVTLGVLLRAMRGNDHHIWRGNQQTILETSARRALFAYDRGLAPNEKWRLKYGAFDDQVRSLNRPMSKPYNLNNFDEKNNFLDSVETILGRVLAVYETVDRIGLDALIYRYALGNLGISYDTVTDFLGRQSIAIDRSPHGLIKALGMLPIMSEY